MTTLISIIMVILAFFSIVFTMINVPYGAGALAHNKRDLEKTLIYGFATVFSLAYIIYAFTIILRYVPTVMGLF